MRPRSPNDLNAFAAVLSTILLFLTALALLTACADATSLKNDDESSWAALLNGDPLDALKVSSSLAGDQQDAGEVAYQPEFLGLDRSIIGRAASSEVPVGLNNNIAKNLNLLPGGGNASYYSFSVPASSAKRDQVSQDILLERDATQEATVELDLQGEEKSSAVLQARQAATGQTVYVTINTCLQPSFVNGYDKQTPPQLTLYVSVSDSNKTPGPDSTHQASVIPLVEGFASWQGQSSNEVYIGVAAPQASIAGNTAWNYELAASVDAPYHSYNDTGPSVFLTDSDPSAALLVTEHLAWLAPDNSSAQAIDDWTATNLPLSIFVANTNNSAVVGVKHSYCGLKNVGAIIDASNTPIRNGITHNQPDSVAEQQFYVPNLNRSSTYFGFLARNGNGTSSGSGVIGGGGTVFANMTFPTKRDSNCAVIYNLTFCNTVEYAVPANPATFPNVDDLKALYDGEAAAKYQNFNYSLQQIPCNTTSTAQYSLARSCDNCASSYKTWLCAVTIPRCEDFISWTPVQFPIGPDDSVDDDAREASGPQGYLMPRNLAQAPLPGAEVPQAALQDPVEMSWLATNSSRNNATIAGKIQPGPYNEVLPCEDLCYDLVRDCPASLGFACPAPGSRMLRASYGRRGQASNGASLCSAPGSVFKVSAAGAGFAVHRWLLWACALSVTSFLVLPSGTLRFVG